MIKNKKPDETAKEVFGMDMIYRGFIEKKHIASVITGVTAETEKENEK